MRPWIQDLWCSKHSSLTLRRFAFLHSPRITNQRRKIRQKIRQIVIFLLTARKTTGRYPTKSSWKTSESVICEVSFQWTKHHVHGYSPTYIQHAMLNTTPYIQLTWNWRKELWNMFPLQNGSIFNFGVGFWGSMYKYAVHVWDVARVGTNLPLVLPLNKTLSSTITVSDIVSFLHVYPIIPMTGHKRVS